MTARCPAPEGYPVAMPSYTDEQKSLALAAVERYGVRPAQRVLMGFFADDEAPSTTTLIAWRDSGEVAVGDEERGHWNELERQRKASWQAAIDSRRDSMLEAVDQATEDRNYLGMMQSSTAVAIFYDKMVPPVRAGVNLNLPGDNPNVTILVTAPAAVGEHRPVPEERVIDVEAT